MQQELFAPSSFTAVDERRKTTEESGYDRWYCIREILYEQYLWDMRCWHKPKYAYSRPEVVEHIKQWLADHEAGKWTNNCGHCLYCIRRLLTNGWASLEEIAGFVLRNNNIKYTNEIGTWGTGFDELLEEETNETSDSLLS